MRQEAGLKELEQDISWTIAHGTLPWVFLTQFWTLLIHSFSIYRASGEVGTMLVFKDIKMTETISDLKWLPV